MVENERLYQLYDIIVENEYITTKQIKELGYKTSDITKMVEDGVLYRIQRGYYNVGDNGLFVYGKYLIDNKNREYGIRVLERSFVIDNTNTDVALQLMLNAVKNKEYDNVLKYYDVLYNSDPDNRDYLYYLYLLSYVIELPEHYKEIVKVLTPSLLYVEEVDNYTALLNNTINLVYNGKLAFAYSRRAGYHRENPKSVYDFAEITILKEAVGCHVSRKKDLEQAINNEEYDRALELLSYDNSVRELPVYTRYVGYLLDDIVRMVNLKEVHEPKVEYKTANLFTAIDNYDYDLALRLSEEHNRANNMDNSKSLIYVLLVKAIGLKKEILGITDDVVEEVVEVTEEVTEEVYEEPVVVEEVVDNYVSYSQLVSKLLVDDIDGFGMLLGTYLRQLDEIGYFSFIASLVEICRLKGYGYNKVLVMLTQLTNGTYVFNEEEYITLFYESIADKDYEVATLYLIMLEGVSSLSDEMIGELNKVINVLKSNVVEVEDTMDEEEVTVQDEVEGQLRMDLDNPGELITQEQKDQMSYQQAGFVPIAKTKKYRPAGTPEEYRQDEEYINTKAMELRENRGLITLRPMDNVRRKRIHDIVSKRKDVTTFSIGEGDNRRIVLRFIGNVYIPLKETIRIADEAYYNKDYETALRAYLDILGTKNPKTFIYAKVGLTYMKMWKIDKAIEYLTVATELSKINNENFDFSELIASLDGSVEKQDKKPKFKMKISEFMETDDNFGVDRIDEMLAFKDVNGLDYEAACEQMGFTYEEYLLSLLVLAKRSYENKQDETGDKFLKMVEKSGNKSKKVVAKMDEVRKNKKFYKNRGQSLTKKSSE